MAYVTGFFLVFAGMLIGYFLWFRDRTEEEQARFAMERESTELRSLLTRAQNDSSLQQERFTRQKGQLNVLQQLCDDWSASREQSERDRVHLEVEIDEKRKRYEHASSELQVAKKKHIDLEDKIHSLTQKNLENTQRVDQDLAKKYAMAEAKNHQVQNELISIVNENERLIQSLHQSEGFLAEQTAELEVNAKLLATATNNAGGLKKEYTTLESSLKESSELLKKSRSECATALSEKKISSDTFSSLQSQHETLKRESDQLRESLTAMDSIQHDNESVKQRLLATEEQLLKATQHRDLALKAEQTSITMAGGLQTRLDNQESTIHGLREKHKDSLEKTKRELHLRSEVESKFDAQVSTLTATLSQLENERDGLATEIKHAQSEIKQQQSRSDALAADSSRLKTKTLRVTELESAMAERDSKLQHESEQLQAAQNRIGELEKLLSHRDGVLKVESDQLATTRNRIVELESVVSQREQRTRDLDGELISLQEQYQTVLRQQAELQTQMSSHTLSEEALESFRTEHDSQLTRLTQKLKSSETTIRQLRRERAGVLARLANYRTIAEPDATVISFKQAMQERQHNNYDQEYGGHTEHHELRGVVYTSEPENRDDLKRISGIAHVLEGRLNDFGIYTFKQIMEWKPQAVEEFSRLLAFRDRIERDNWKEQAQHFYQQKASEREKMTA